NVSDESAAVSDTVTLKELPAVTSFLINNGAARTTNRKVTLNKAKSATVADAGIDQLARRGDVITLDGSGSFSAEGEMPLMYEWGFVSLPPGTGSILSDPRSANPTFTMRRQGRYEIQLVVKDGCGAVSEPDTVIISALNTTPVADAGSDQSFHDAGIWVTLNGAQSYDPDGDILAYQWTFISRPAGSAASLEGAHTANPSFIADAPGEYRIRLTVTDGQSNRASDTVSVSFGNVRPVANAGKSMAVKVGEAVTLSGDGMDANGNVLSYRWILSSRPGESRSEVADASARVTTFVPDRAGTYVAQLVVSDGELDSEPSAIQIQAYTVQTEAITALQEMAAGIAALDISAFKNGDMQNILLNKLNSVIANVEAGKYTDAANQMRNDIMPKMGSAENREEKSAACEHTKVQTSGYLF
ncbi:MAG TPA: PKD domain-containing protein, partial [Candidatus Brocadiaceae bacterium]|nr:PKD domain-containing protein [Candidatus Brocadiaceae bacterium]